MFRYVVQIVFSIMSVSNIFSAEKTYDINFFKLDATDNGSFHNTDGIGLYYQLHDADLNAHKGVICKFLKEKLAETYKEYSDKLLKFYYVGNGYSSFMGKGSSDKEFLVGEINDEESTNVEEVIVKSPVEVNDPVEVYFYPHDLPDKAKIKTDKNNKPSKAKTGRTSKKTKDVGKGPVINHNNSNKDNQKKNSVNNNVKKKKSRCCYCNKS